MKVLIVKMSALGDVINALPVLDYLHQVSRGVEVDWVVEEQFKEIVEENPLISQVHVARTKAWRKRPLAGATFREITALKEALQERKYDLVFDIQGNLKSGVITWLSGAANRIGFARQDLQEPVNRFFTTRQIPQRRQDYHVTDKYLRLVSVPFGRDFSEMELKTTISTSPQDDANGAALMATLGDGLAFLFHCGTTWQTKFWHRDGWIALGKGLLERFPDSTVLFSWGSEAERQNVVEISQAIGPGARVLERYTLKGLTALMKKVDLVVGGDTGPVHLAAAVGTPTVSFYRSSDGRGSGPRGANHVVIQSPLVCTRCFKTRCEKDQACRESITAEAMLGGCLRLLDARSDDD